MKEWLIIGGGIHGTYMANLLVTKFSVPLDRLVILDPHDSPCMQWKIMTCKTGMTYLRSPIYHHVDLDACSLEEFMKSQSDKSWAVAYGKYQRPSLRLFNEHIDHVVEKAGLHECYRVGRALDITDRGSYLKVDTTTGSLNTRRVLLAISPTEDPRFPAWAAKLKAKNAPIRHVFDDDFYLTSIVPGFSYAVLGKGLSALQLALYAAKLSPGKTHLLSNGRIPIHKFDSDPCWLGPRCLEPFGKEKDLTVRRSIITNNMLNGSVPQEVAMDILQASAKDQILHVSHDPAVDGQFLRNGKFELTLSNGEKLVVDRVILATGFDHTCPGSGWLGDVITKLRLPLHSDGYPIVDRYLRWHRRIFVTGALGELEVGPAARNIFGATLAGHRISQLLEHSASSTTSTAKD